MQRIKCITVATQDTPELQALIRSAKRHGMDLTVLGLGETWQGFGMKIIKTREYLKTLEGYTHFIFVDAYDTLFLKQVTTIPDVILFSAEKNCWPYPEKAKEYPESKSIWKYLNSGSYSSSIEVYLKVTDNYPVLISDDDQAYFTDIFLSHLLPHNTTTLVSIDSNCRIFQSYAFAAEGDFSITDVLTNNITKTQPAIVHFNGKCHDQKIYNMVEYSTLSEVKERWKDTPEQHKEIHETFIRKVNDNPKLSAHRTFVENHVMGFGERSFHWMWNLLVKELPKDFTFLEVGVFKGQVLSLIKLLADQHGKKVKRYGVTPLSNEGLEWGMEDYKAAIDILHDEFKLAKDYELIVGLSQAPEVIKKACGLQCDIVFIDGAHNKEVVDQDFKNYAPLVKKGGFLVVDDAGNRLKMPFGYFQGIEDVSKSLEEFEGTELGQEFKFLFNVVHDMVYQRI